MEESERSEEECDLKRESFDSCSDFEVMSKKTHRRENDRISKHVGDGNIESNRTLNGEKIRVQKIHLFRDPMSNKVKSLKTRMRIDNQIIKLTVDTGSPVSFLNWATTKEVIDESNKARFIPFDKLNLATQFVDYKKQPICVLGGVEDKSSFERLGVERGCDCFIAPIVIK